MNTKTHRPSLAGMTEQAAAAAISVACKTLYLSGTAQIAESMAQEASRQRLSHHGYLAEVLTYECDEREDRRRTRRVKEAKFPRPKRLEDLDLTCIPDLPPATLTHLAGGSWIDAGEPLVLLGNSGTGKTHLLIGLGTAAAEQGRRVKYMTAAALINELVEAADNKELSRLVGKYARLDLLCLDEVGYIQLDTRLAA